MSKIIGIIAAEEKEMEAIKDIMTNIEKKSIFNLYIITGQINNKNYVLTKCGIGKVNAARTTQILIDKFDIEYIINVGSAGGLNSKLNIGDIVIGDKLVQHDFDLTAFGYEKGYIPEIGKLFESDQKIVEKAKNIDLEDVNIITGIIASGDIFCKSTDLKENIIKEFKADCVEMEGAAIAQVCCLNDIPFIIIRSISDIPNNNNEIDFEKYLEYASKNCAKFINKL